MQNPEISKRYDQCEVISKEIQEVRVQKCALESELAAFRRKEKKSQWYQRKKRICRNKTQHGNRTSAQRLSSSDLNTSDESDFSFSSPPSFTGSYSYASRSTSQKLSVCKQQKSTHTEITVTICGVCRELYVTLTLNWNSSFVKVVVTFSVSIYSGACLP